MYLIRIDNHLCADRCRAETGHGTTVAVGDETRFRELISQTSGYTDEQVIELRSLASQIGNLGTDWRDKAQFRAAIETIGAIRKFDKASGDMVRRGNLINSFVLAFAILAAILGGVACWIAWLSYRLALSR